MIVIVTLGKRILEVEPQQPWGKGERTNISQCLWEINWSRHMNECFNLIWGKIGNCSGGECFSPSWAMTDRRWLDWGPCSVQNCVKRRIVPRTIWSDILMSKWEGAKHCNWGRLQACILCECRILSSSFCHLYRPLASFLFYLIHSLLPGLSWPLWV